MFKFVICNILLLFFMLVTSASATTLWKIDAEWANSRVNPQKIGGFSVTFNDFDEDNIINMGLPGTPGPDSIYEFSGVEIDGRTLTEIMYIPTYTFDGLETIANHIGYPRDVWEFYIPSVGGNVAGVTLWTYSVTNLSESSNPAPEPSTIFLFSLGILFFAAHKRKLISS